MRSRAAEAQPSYHSSSTIAGLLRQQMLDHGAGSVSDAGLVALALGGGMSIDAGRQVASRYGSLGVLQQATAHELAELPGVGMARALQLKAALELGRRSCGERPRRGQRIQSAAALYEHVRAQLAHLQHEVFLAIALDAKHRPIETITVAQGTLASVDVHPREAFRALIKIAAAACFFCHNHPSGDPEPSPDDLALTTRLRDVGRLVGIAVLDHVIVAGEGYVSLAERGLL